MSKTKFGGGASCDDLIDSASLMTNKGLYL
jgi:hypothetical protein